MILVLIAYVKISNKFEHKIVKFEPQHEISNNVAFGHVNTQTSLCSLLLSLETPNGVQSVA